MLADRSRRRWERHDITIPVEVTTIVNGERSVLSGRASDISRGGLRLFLTREMELGTSVKMEFLLPYHSMQLVIRGVVRSRDGFTHGVEFSNPTSFQQQIIERTCNVFGLLR
jgi:PilZ domain-containing protein